jgi:hypothetical protein
MAKVRTPEGTRWKVGRRWLGRRLRLKKPDPSEGGSFDLGFGDDLGGIFAVLAALVVLAIVFLFAWVVLAFVIELVVIVVVVGAGLFSRVVLRRPWTLYAIDERGEQHEWQVVGWRASRAQLAAVRGALAAGLPLPDRPAT